MRVGRLHCPHHAYQGNTEQAHHSDECTPICRHLQHVNPNYAHLSELWLDDSTFKWSSVETDEANPAKSDKLKGMSAGFPEAGTNKNTITLADILRQSL
jgi:hypothetical protein